MELTIERDELAKVILIAANFATKKTTIPILSNLFLEATEDELIVIASDIEISIKARVKANIKKKGVTTINAELLANILREMQSGALSMKLIEGERVNITNSVSKYRMNSIPPESYPLTDSLNYEVNSYIDADSFSDMIKKTSYATAIDTDRIDINGICLEINSVSNKTSAFKMVATDGHRLCVVTRQFKNVGFEDRIILPKRAVLEIQKILNQEYESQSENKLVKTGITNGYFIIETNNFKTIIRLNDTEYPDYSLVIPKKIGEKAIVAGKDLCGALRRVVLTIPGLDKCAKLSLSKDKLKVSTQSAQFGDANEVIDINYSGKELNIGFNGQYLYDMIEAFGENVNICMELYGEKEPGKFTSDNDDSALAIIMPMRL